MDIEEEQNKIKKLLFKYSVGVGYGDDLRSALISAISILGFDKMSILDELDFILRYESSKEITKEYYCWIEKINKMNIEEEQAIKFLKGDKK